MEDGDKVLKWVHVWANENLRFGFLEIRGNWVQGFGEFCRYWGFRIGV